jgi:hypothetical protein
LAQKRRYCAAQHEDRLLTLRATREVRGHDDR